MTAPWSSWNIHDKNKRTVVNSPQLSSLVITHNLILWIFKRAKFVSNSSFSILPFLSTNDLCHNHTIYKVSKSLKMNSERSTAKLAHTNIPHPTPDGLCTICFVNRVHPSSHVNQQTIFSSTTKKCLQDTFSQYEARRDFANHVFCQVCAWRA